MITQPWGQVAMVFAQIAEGRAISHAERQRTPPGIPWGFPVLPGGPPWRPRPPYGYRWRDPEKSGYAVDETPAPIVRRIFAAVAEGQSLRRVMMDLNSENIRSPTGKAEWNRSAIHAILSHPIYGGRLAALRHATERLPGDGRRLLSRDAAGQWPASSARPVPSPTRLLSIPRGQTQIYHVNVLAHILVPAREETDSNHEGTKMTKGTKNEVKDGAEPQRHKDHKDRGPKTMT